MYRRPLVATMPKDMYHHHDLQHVIMQAMVTGAKQLHPLRVTRFQWHPLCISAWLLCGKLSG